MLLATLDLYAFEVLPTTSTLNGELDYFPRIRRGNLKVDLTFKEALPENMTLVVMGKFPDTFMTDR